MDRETRDAIERLERKIDVKSDNATKKMDAIVASVSKLLGPLARLAERVRSLGLAIKWLFGILAGVLVAVIVLLIEMVIAK